MNSTEKTILIAGGMIMAFVIAMAIIQGRHDAHCLRMGYSGGATTTMTLDTFCVSRDGYAIEEVK